MTRLVIEIDPRAPEQYLRDIYKRAREELAEEGLVDNSVRRLKPHVAEMAVFLARHRGESWGEMRRQWNEAHPEHGEATDSEFKRQAERAYERVRGRPYGGPPLDSKARQEEGEEE